MEVFAEPTLTQAAWESACVEVFRRLDLPSWVSGDNLTRMADSYAKEGDGHYIPCAEMNFLRRRYEEDLDGLAYAIGDWESKGRPETMLAELAARADILRASAEALKRRE